MILINMVLKPISSITMLEPQWFGINIPSKFPWSQPLLILLSILCFLTFICWFDLQKTYLFRVLHFLLIFWLDVEIVSKISESVLACLCLPLVCPAPYKLEAFLWGTIEGREINNLTVLLVLTCTGPWYFYKQFSLRHFVGKNKSYSYKPKETLLSLYSWG